MTAIAVRTGLVSTTDLDQAFSIDSLAALAGGEVLAMVVPNFTSPDICKLISDRLISDHRLGGYATNDGAASIKRLGMSLFEAAGADPEKLQSYYTAARKTITALRRLSRPVMYPMDHLRLVMQESWPAGANFESLHFGQKMFVGMPRVFGSNSSALPHVDRLAWDVPGVAAAESITAQIAVNVHLRTAERGGEVELWELEPDATDYEMLRLTGSYGLDRAKIPAPSAVIAPKVGDLILFNSHRVHAVRACSGGPRVTVSGFVAYRSEFEPLTYWS